MHDYGSDSVTPHVPADALAHNRRPSGGRQSGQRGGGHTAPIPRVLDRSALVDRLMGDEALAHEIVEVFIKEVPGQINTLKRAAGDGDVELIQRTAHTIKGAAANVGAAALHEASRRLEVAASAAEWDAVESLLQRLESEYGELVWVVRATRFTGYGDG